MLRKSSTKDAEPNRLPDVFATMSFPESELLSEEEFVRVFEEYSGLLKSVAIRKFRVPADDAESLVHEVFLSYIKQKAEVKDLQAWFVGAICNASRYYWRRHGRSEQLDVEPATARDDSAASLPEPTPIFDDLLASLPSRYQHILRLRYVEGYSIKEIAEDLGVTPKYTERLVAKCLRMAEQRYRALSCAGAPEQNEADNEAVRKVVAGFVEAYQDVG